MSRFRKRHHHQTQPTTRAQWAAKLGEVARTTTDQMLREHGLVQPPTVHMLAEDMDQPYVGFITSRPYYRGSDAEQAITTLGLLPSVLPATALVVTWEHLDMCASVQLTTRDQPSLAVLDTPLAGDRPGYAPEHTLTWHRFDMHPGPANRDGAPTVRPTWHPPTTVANPPLPLPICCLLNWWRKSEQRDLKQTLLQLEQAGYRVRFAELTG